MVTNSLTTQKKATFSTFITSDAVKTKINQMIASKDGNKFITSIISLVANNPAIAECDHTTILSSALLGESLKLSSSPQLGQYYIVPFKDNDKEGKLKRIVATFQLGYKGYIQLAIRSGYYKKLNVLAIKEGELKNYNPLEETLDVKLIENEEEREKANTTGYYAMFEYHNGFRKTLYWSKEKMQAHAKKYSQSYRTDIKKGWNYSFWSKDFDGMAYKTMLRQLISKWGIMSVEFQRAVISDTAMIDNNNNPVYVDNNDTEIEEEIIYNTADKTETLNNSDPFSDFIEEQ
ncbi:MAG: recombinase RecT [Candidatus Gastranaerophilales bacterium]|nr:recombinase RecT [Candidatus Gastranaerophilales bacterium]